MLSPSSCTDMCKNACGNIIYIYIIPMGYIEYKIDNFGLKNISRNRLKKPIHRIKTFSGIGKKQHIHRIFPAIHFDPGK